MKASDPIRTTGGVLSLHSWMIRAFIVHSLHYVVSFPFFLRLYVVTFMLAGAGAIAMRVAEEIETPARALDSRRRRRS